MPRYGDRQCTSPLSDRSRRCTRPAILGGTVCATHGGRNPKVKAKAAERIAQAKNDALSLLLVHLKADLAKVEKGEYDLSAFKVHYSDLLATVEKMQKIQDLQEGKPTERVERITIDAVDAEIARLAAEMESVEHA